MQIYKTLYAKQSINCKVACSTLSFWMLATHTILKQKTLLFITLRFNYLVHSV